MTVHNYQYRHCIIYSSFNATMFVVGNLSKFDGMVFPADHVKSRTAYETLISNLKYLKSAVFRSDVEEKEMKFPNYNQTQEDSLNIFLDHYRAMLLTSDFAAKFDFLGCVHHVYHVYLQLRQHCTSDGVAVHTDFVPSLTKVHL